MSNKLQKVLIPVFVLLGCALVAIPVSAQGVGRIKAVVRQMDAQGQITGQASISSGPASSTDNALTRWDGTGGDSVQDSSLLLADSGQVAWATGLGAITHLLGPDDETLSMKQPDDSRQDVVLRAGSVKHVSGSAAGNLTLSGGRSQTSGGSGAVVRGAGRIVLAGAHDTGGGTAGSVTIDAGGGSSNVSGPVTIGGTNASAVNIGRSGINTDFSGDLRLPADNDKLQFGAGQDAEVYYDGTNLVLDPDAVGSGLVDVDGEAQSDAYRLSELSSDPSAPADGEAAVWFSDGTGIGEDGDLVVQRTLSSTTEEVALGVDGDGLLAVKDPNGAQDAEVRVYASGGDFVKLGRDTHSFLDSNSAGVSLRSGGSESVFYNGAIARFKVNTDHNNNNITDVGRIVMRANSNSGLVLDGSTSTDGVLQVGTGGANQTDGQIHAQTIAKDNGQAIADDAVHQFTPGPNAGFLIVQTDGDAAAFVYDVSGSGTISKLGELGTTFETATSDLGGTDGTDGKITVSADGGNGQIDVENRTGAEITVRIGVVG